MVCAVFDGGAEEGVRAGSQRQTPAALEGQGGDGLMKEGTVWAVVLGGREYDAFRRL